MNSCDGCSPRATRRYRGRRKSLSQRRPLTDPHGANMDAATQFDLVVIGGGPGGYGAALYAASAGLNAAVIEMADMGGTCLNRGCIPAKAFLETAAVNRHVEHAAEFGIETSAPSVNFAVTQARKQKLVDGLVRGVTGLFKARKVVSLAGVGSLGAD